jgi:trk system potassium uptake protein TrkA
MRIVILGCGRVGANLANSLDSEGHAVSIIDHNSESFRRFLSTEFRGSAILGNGLDEDVLKSAGIEQADAFAAVTDRDNTNIMASQVAQMVFGVKKVVCRIYDPNRNEAYRTLGLETVAPILISANRIRDMLKTGEERLGLRPQPPGSPETRG